MIYYRDEPLVDTNLFVDAAVAQREADSVIVAKARTIANLAVGRHRIRPKKAERLGNKIYFSVSFLFQIYFLLTMF